MTAVPPETPVTTPVTSTIEAIVASLLLHVPPAVASLSVVVRPTHTNSGLPVGTAVVGYTVTTMVPIQPVGGKIVMVAVPTLLPVVAPKASTDATAGLLLLHVPDTRSVSNTVLPIQIEVVPVIGGGAVLTFTVTRVRHPVGNA